MSSNAGFSFAVTATDATTRGFQSAMAGAKKFAGGFERTISAPFRALGSLNTMAFIANFKSIVGVMGAVGNVVREQEQAFSRLRVSLANSRYAAGLTTKQVADMAGKMAAITGIEDEAIMEGEAVLARISGLRGRMFFEASKAMVNMSAALGSSDLTGTAKMIGIAMQDPIRGMALMRRSGAALSISQTALVKSLVETGNAAKAQGVILDALKSKFGGYAAEMGNTTSGALAKMKIAFDDVAKAAAGVASPIVKEIANAAEGMARSIADKIEPFKDVVEANMTTVKALAVDLGKTVEQSLGLSWTNAANAAEAAGTKMSGILKLIGEAGAAASETWNVASGFGHAAATTVQSARSLVAGYGGRAVKLAGGGYFGADNEVTRLGEGLIYTAEKAQASATRHHEAGNATIDQVGEGTKRWREWADRSQNRMQAMPANVASYRLNQQRAEAREQVKVQLSSFQSIGDGLKNTLGRAWSSVTGSAKESASASSKAFSDRAKAAADAVADRFKDLQDEADKLAQAKTARLMGANAREGMGYELREARAKSDTERRSIQFERAKALFTKAESSGDSEEKSQLYEQGRSIAFDLAKNSAVSRDPRARKMTDRLLARYQERIASREDSAVGNAESYVANARDRLADAERRKRDIEGAQKLQAAKEALAPMRGAVTEAAKAVGEFRQAIKDTARAMLSAGLVAGRKSNGQAEAGAAGSLNASAS